MSLTVLLLINIRPKQTLSKPLYSSAGINLFFSPQESVQRTYSTRVQAIPWLSRAYRMSRHVRAYTES